ncbi:MAG: FAD-binding oxidoreductase [Vallitaleaceae bacterium]|nr:FAD-binding oxidoreductase [Vallitaleaceae bacterium]
MEDFLYGLTGRVVTPVNPTYNEERQGFNRAKQKYPLIIVYCRNKCDVSNAVKWSRKHQVPLRVRSGGHHYEGYSNGDLTLVIDISEMNGMKLNECKRRLCVQAGVTNGQVYDFISSKGYPFPGGTCPTVGVSGYALGGGWGLSCRYLGLGCDNLLQIEMVDCNGDIIRASKTDNSDLFWACRGAGGGNFGVIVSMTFRLPTPVDQVTLIEIDYLHVSSVEQEAFLHIWQQWLKTADKKMTLISRIYNSEHDGLSMLVRGIFYGNPEEAKIIVKEFITLEGAKCNFEYLTFLEAITIIGSAYPTYEKFQSASRFVLKDISDDQIADIVGLIKKPSEGSVFAGISMYALGGKVSEVGMDDTAFFYRRAKYIIWLETIWEDNRYAEENMAWIGERFPYLEAVTKGSYVNFPYGKLEDYLEEYYGCHVQALIKIKMKYDPHNIFTFPQGIKKADQYYQLTPDMDQLFDERVEKEIKDSNDARYRGFRYV